MGAITKGFENVSIRKAPALTQMSSQLGPTHPSESSRAGSSARTRFQRYMRHNERVAMLISSRSSHSTDNGRFQAEEQHVEQATLNGLTEKFRRKLPGKDSVSKLPNASTSISLQKRRLVDAEPGIGNGKNTRPPSAKDEARSTKNEIERLVKGDQ